MKHDFDDTVTGGLRPDVLPAEPDLDDTVIVSSRKRSDVVQPYVGRISNRESESAELSSRSPTRGSTKQATSARTIAVPSAKTQALHYRVQVDGAAVAHNLEHPCVFGRDPRPPRIVRGVGPRLIAVQSPTREVSETHVEVRQLGASVIVTDLRSTNGSVVQVPGNAARKLRQGESVVVSAGTLVDIGDGNIIRILPRRRLE